MFNKKDYRAYFKQLYAVEVMMHREAKELQSLVHDPEAIKLLKDIEADELRHMGIVKDLEKLI